MELLRKAESCMDKLDLEKAVSLLDEGIRRFPNDTLILDLYTDLLIQLGEQAKAKTVSGSKCLFINQFIEKSINLNPKQDGHKYLNLAEMLTSNDAVAMYRKGIEIL